jgi:transcriptional regulator with XRE-family HTH domain
MGDLDFKTIEELEVILGKKIRAVRHARGLDQRTAAEKAGIAEKSLRNLEGGHGSTVETLLRTLKALNSLDGLELLAATPTVNPLALLSGRRRRPRRQVEGRQ